MDNKQKTFVDILIETANKQNEKVAIIENEGKVQTTYTELLSMARKIAFYIHSKGVAEHSFVAVKLGDGRDYVAAEWGIWMARCVSVPMGTTFPQQRIDYIMEHCESPLMIDDSVVAECQGMPEAEINLPDVEDDAMLIYTSGSTGNPKGILHTFATIGSAFARRTDVVPRFTADLQYGNYAPMYFVAKIGVYGALLVGATVHFYSKELRTDMQKLSDYIAEYGINRSYIPPAALQIFKNKAESLKYVTTGSEKLTTQYSKDGYEVINNYGMSETFASVAFFKLPDHPMDSVPVGKMAEGLEYVIADEEGNPVADGEIGEMCFKEHLCKEYYKDPEKTAELFRGGLMHTGDLVREVDGLIYYIQRKDWMVKINGQRVEPSEVEVVIRRIEGVKNAVVKGFDSEDGSQYIVGYYILEDGATLSSEEVTAELSKSVPPYMVPRFMVEMKVFPINLNGKIDRKSLQSPEDSVDGVSINYVAPTNDIEKQLCEAMAKLLGYKLLGIEDDFLALGADSIRIMKLQQMCPDLGLSSRLIHTCRTPKAIAAQLAQSLGGAEASHVDVHEPQPLTQTQLGIYVECEKRQGEAVYNNPFLLRLDDDVDLQKFAVAVEIAIAAHPGVSAAIMEADDGTPMLYMPKENWQPSVCTIEEVSDEELESIKHDLMQPFNLKGDRLYRIRIFKTPTAKYVFFDFHHIIFDGTSMHIFLGDVSKAYTGNSVAREVYTAYDVAYDEQQVRNTDALQKAKAWYAETFGESLEPTIPTGDTDDKAIAFGHSVFEISMTPEQLDAWCADHGVTANVLATTTFGKVLATYANSDNALFATIYNGRTDLRTARTMDMLVKTFPVSVSIDKETTVQDLLNTTKQQMMGAMANDIYSFAELASDTGMTSDVMFVYQGDMHQVQVPATAPGESPVEPLRFRGEHLDFNATGERFNVQMLSTAENTLILDIQYYANSYSEAFIARFAKAYDTALREMTIREKVANVQLLTEEAKAELLGIGRGRALAYDTNETLVSIFRRQAAATPDATAVVYLDRQLSYRQLDDLTDRLAACLVRKGVGRESVVGVMIARSELMTVYPMAVMKAGGAYMPLDPDFPEDRLSFMIEDAGVRLILSDDGLAGSVLPEFDGEVFEASQLAELPQVAASETGEGPAPDSLMIILYTSGSTGRPKGVLLEQQSIVNFCHWYVHDFKMTSEDRAIAYANFGFDAHMMDIYPTFLAGATVHILDNEIRHDLDAMAEYINRNRITIAFMTTQICCQMVSLFDMPSMRLMSAGGERMPHMECPSFDFYNGYGPTECSLFSTFYKVVGPFDGKIIGRPLSNYQLYVVDKYLNLVPLGAKGELVVSGVAVGRGYLNRPDVNRDKFVEYRQKHAYRTGDEVRWTHCEEKPSDEYDIEYFGRMDGQVKLRGLRIELGEVENAMNVFPGVRQSAAAVKEMAGTQHLCGYYVTTDGGIDEEELRRAMKQSLTDFMIPEFFVEVDALPYNANGKVDRKRLPDPDGALVTDGAEAPRVLNVLELRIVDMACRLLGVDSVGIGTPLLSYGMSSLLAMRFAVQLFKEFGVKMKGKELAHGSILDIENELLVHLMSPDARNEDHAASESPVADSSAVSIASAPLSYAQMGVYYDIVRNPGSISYNMPFVCTFPEGISAEVLQRAVSAVVASHKILGTHFEIRGTDVVQVYPADFVPDIEMGAAETEEEYEAVKADFVRPFNPATGPLYRIKILSYRGQACMFMDTLHLVMDGASEALFFKQLVDALGGVEPEVEKYNFFEYAIDEQKLSQTPEYAASEQFFTDALKTVDGVSHITEDLQPQEGAEGLLAFAERMVDMERVSDAARSLGVTPMSIFLAAAYYTVSRYTNTPDVCLCTISNGRSNLLISETVGMFVNTVAITSHITDVTVRDFILKTAGDFSATLDHENYPFARIAEKFGISPTLFFQYQVGVLDDIMVRIPGTDSYGPIKREGFAESTPKFKFTISIESKPGDGVAVQIQYDDTLYSQQLAQGFADAMVAVLDHFVADVDASLKTVSMLDEEQAALIATFHETKEADVPVVLYHRLFEKSVAEHADELALVALNPYTKIYETYTYAKLNEQMNRIAYALIERGLKPCDRVAILLPRTSRLIMSQYAILKAGGAYIPCDPKYPAERINLILEDSESRFIITTKDRLAEFPGRAIDVEELLGNSELLTINNDATVNPDVQVSPDDLAYLIYTSGSTGRPKGVQLMHKGVCNYHHGENLIQMCLKNECHAALGITTISFDMSVWETGSPLMHGKTLVFVGDDDCNDPNRLAVLISDYCVDCMTATTSRFMQLLESPAFEEVFAKHIRLAYQGGEGLSVALLHKLQSYPNVRIFNGYGPTETIANSHASELTHDSVAHIGKPCVNYTNFIIDNDGNELPVGVVGELVIGGRSVAKGYNNLPEQTASRFVEYQGQRVYKSGDYARWMPDGNVVLLGRKDNQVKLRGLRIELGEVESAITKVEGVKNVTVMIKKLAGKDHLCAYFTADRAIAIDDMKEEISKTLTHYMVPTAYLQMEAFPLTPNGKTDVKNLPEPELAKVGGDYVAPNNTTEADFCDIFGKILELDKVSAVDSFFDLGGSSLTATRVVIEATNKGYQVSYAEVFDNPTPRKLARLVGGGADEAAVDKEVADYDYTAVDNLLANNTLDSFQNGERLELGDVILTGANGYLGIHILRDLLENHIKQHPENKVYCLVRHGRNGVTSKARLRNLLFYYFEKSYNDLFDTQLMVIDGDVTSDKAFDELEKVMIEANPECKVRTLINCAAIVKHFSEGTEIEDINIGGLQKCVDFCLKTSTQLVQTSTNSTGGQLPQTEITPDTQLDEQHSYVGQLLKSKYTRSKFLAERIVLSAIVNEGLVGKVMRLGNLSPRSADGEFQINFRSNSSMGRLHIYQMLGVYGYGTNEIPMEFSPIDEVARAVLELSQTPKECVVFHPINNHYVLLGDVVREMANTLGISIEEVEDDSFRQKLHEAGQDPEKAKVLQSMLAYANGNDNLVYVPANNNHTNRVLSRLGFHWNVTSWDYVQKFIKAIATLDFFEDKR